MYGVKKEIGRKDTKKWHFSVKINSWYILKINIPYMTVYKPGPN